MDEETTQASLDAYKMQLDQVETALNAAGSEDNEDLVKLKEDLSELIHLTQESLLSIKKKNLLSSLEPTSSTSSTNDGTDMDAEFAAFKAAIAEDESSSSSCNSQQEVSSNHANHQQNLDPDHQMDDISGTKCRAPFSHDWGGLQHHNAMILSVEPLNEHQEPRVKVLFCNPTHQSMRPCPYFLEEKCHFTDALCKFSHGYSVEVDQLQEFKDPDYSGLKLESECLAKYHDGLWYKAIIVEVDQENHQYQVMFTDYNETDTLDIQDILPIGDSDESSDSDDSDMERLPVSRSDSDNEDEDDILPVYLWRPPKTLQVMGAWEAHTKGIGSKLMEKMGYVIGQGLGKNGEGRAEPVPIQLLPQGKSLDKIMELKAIAGDLDLYDVMKRKEREAKKASTSAAKQYHKHRTGNVFDFINKKLRGKKGDIHNLTKKQSQNKAQNVTHISEGDLKTKNDRSINVQLLKTHEEMKGVQKEMSKLKQAVQRNESRDPKMANQLKKKLSSMESYLRQLQESERTMERHKQTRKDHKKLTVF